MRTVSIVMMTVFQTVYIYCAQFVAFGVLFEVVLNTSQLELLSVGSSPSSIRWREGFLPSPEPTLCKVYFWQWRSLCYQCVGIAEIGGFIQMGTVLTESMGSDFMKPFRKPSVNSCWRYRDYQLPIHWYWV